MIDVPKAVPEQIAHSLYLILVDDLAAEGESPHHILRKFVWSGVRKFNSLDNVPEKLPAPEDALHRIRPGPDEHE